jgi:ribonuclease HI
MYTLHFDGMLRTAGNDGPNKPGFLGYGWLIQRNGTEIARGFGVFLRNCRAGSNAAEYLALIDGLEALADLRIAQEQVEIRGDAKCVIDQMIGTATVSAPLTKTLHRRARKLSRRFASLTWTWVPRRENRFADSLSRRSFLFLHNSSHLDMDETIPQKPYLFKSGLIPLVDLRIHSPLIPSGGRLSNS